MSSTSIVSPAALNTTNEELTIQRIEWTEEECNSDDNVSISLSREEVEVLATAFAKLAMKNTKLTEMLKKLMRMCNRLKYSKILFLPLCALLW